MVGNPWEDYLIARIDNARPERAGAFRLLEALVEHKECAGRPLGKRDGFKRDNRGYVEEQARRRRVPSASSPHSKP